MSSFVLNKPRHCLWKDLKVVLMGLALVIFLSVLRVSDVSRWYAGRVTGVSSELGTNRCSAGRIEAGDDQAPVLFWMLKPQHTNEIHPNNTVMKQMCSEKGRWGEPDKLCLHTKLSNSTWSNRQRVKRAYVSLVRCTRKNTNNYISKWKCVCVGWG